MREEQIKFISDLMQNRISPGVIELFPFEVIGITSDSGIKNCILMDTSLGKKYLWIYQGQEASLAYQLQVLQQCKQNKVSGLLYPLKLNNDCTYSRLDERNLFYLTNWEPFHKISYSNNVHIKGIIKTLVEFRRATSKAGMIYCLPEKRLAHNLANKMDEIEKSMEAFLMLAKNRLKPTEFDNLLIQNYQKLYESINNAKSAFAKTNYLKLHYNLKTNNLIIYNLDRNNLRINSENEACCLRLKNFHWDIPVIDLAILLAKSGRSNGWTLEWYHMTIDEYLKYYQCTEAEIEIINAYLAFPWSICRLISRYYYNRVNWSVSKYIEKFKRLLKDEFIRRNFIETNLLG